MARLGTFQSNKFDPILLSSQIVGFQSFLYFTLAILLLLGLSFLDTNLSLTAIFDFRVSSLLFGSWIRCLMIIYLHFSKSMYRNLKEFSLSLVSSLTRCSEQFSFGHSWSEEKCVWTFGNSFDDFKAGQCLFMDFLQLHISLYSFHHKLFLRRSISIALLLAAERDVFGNNDGDRRIFVSEGGDERDPTLPVSVDKGGSLNAVACSFHSE